jgi:hypothetical protein
MDIGQTFEVDCPFVRAPYTEYDDGGVSTVLSWKPGIVWEQSGPEDADMRAHGMGKVRYTVISLHKLPYPYPARVFFTRKWVSPDGRVFGTRKLHVMTVEAFRRRTVSYKPAGADFYTQLIVQDMDENERVRALT